MKKSILPVILFLVVVLFLPPKANAQTSTDCQKTRARASYNCLTEWTKCYYPCVDKTKDVSACYKACKQSEDVCNKQVDADYQACLAAIPKSQVNSSPTTAVEEDAKPTVSEVKKERPAPSKKEGQSWLEFLGINPYQTWLRLQEIVEVTEFYASGELEESLEGGFLNLFGRKSIRQRDQEATERQEAAYEAAFGKDWREKIQQLSQPEIDTKTETEAWNIPVPKDRKVIDVPEAADTKRYSWDENSGVVIKSNDWEKVKFRESVEVNGFTSHKVELTEGEIEVKVRNNNPAENQFGVDAGWLGVTVSRTHFRVLSDRTNKSAAMIVYKGEVEVKTRDGKTVKVRPDGDKPGILGVSQKLSPVKLATVGVILITALGGVILILRKRFLSKPFKNRK